MRLEGGWMLREQELAPQRILERTLRNGLLLQTHE
jgi:hypothetical protein